MITPNRNKMMKLQKLTWLILAGATIASTGWAEDPTSRHPMDIHPMEGVKPEHVEKIMSMTEAQILAAMPEQTPRIHTGCPDLHADKKEVTWMDKGERGQLRHIWYWDYDPLKPDVITCKISGTSYPDNPKYPENHVQTFTNPMGKTFEIKSFLEKGDPDSEFKSKQRDKHYYMRGALDTARWYWMREQMVNLARLYHLTKEEKYAEKALVIFNAYCDRFPEFLMCTGYGRHYKDAKGKLDRRVVTRSGRRGGSDGAKQHMWPTFDLLYNSEAMKNSKQRFGQDLREKYIQNVVEYCTNTGKPLTESEKKEKRRKQLASPLKGGQQGAPGPSRWDLINNDTEMLRRVVRNWEIFPFHTFTVDGGYLEGLGYGSIQLLKTASFRNMNGYSDPPGFRVPSGEKRYENFQHPTGEYEKFYARALEVHEALRLPNGSKVTFQDSSSSTSASFIKRDDLTRAVNINRPGIEHVILGDGEGKDMVQAHLGFGNGTWHSHRDTLGFQLWGKGHYLISDISYPKNRLRAEYSTNLYHNTVTVDARGHTTNMGDGDVVLYEPNLPGFSVVKVDAPRAYLGNPEIYSRQLMLVTTQPERPYVIDVFRVQGGKVKDYVLISSTNHKTKASYDLNLRDMPGEAPLESFNKRYKAFTKMSEGDGSKNFSFTYEIQDPKPHPKLPDGEQPKQAGSKHHFVGGPDMTVFKTQIPTNSSLSGGGHEKFSDYPGQWPTTIVRHEGEESLFVAVHEPYEGKPAIRSVKRINAPGNVLALEIAFPDRTDRLIMSLTNEPVQAQAGGMTLDGKVGFVARMQDGRSDAYLIGGSSFTEATSKTNLTQKVGEFTGTISESARLWDEDDLNGFALQGNLLPGEGEELEGSWIQLANRGQIHKIPERTHNFRAPYKRGTRREDVIKDGKSDPKAEFFFDRSGIETTVEIDRVEKRQGKTWLITKRDHGIRVDGGQKVAEEVFIPARKAHGKETTFSIVRGISNQARPVVSPAGGAFMEPVEVSLSSPAPGADVEYAFAPYGSEAPLEWKKSEGTMTLDSSGKLHVRSVSPQGIKAPLPDAYTFRFAADPDPVNAESLQAGLMAEFRILHIAGEVDSGMDKPDFDLPGKNDYQYFDSAYTKFHVQKYFDREYLAAVEAQPKGSILDLIERFYAYGDYFGRKVFTGYVNAPADGVYTFYFRRNHDGYLEVDGQRLLDYHGHIGEPIAQSVQMPLTKGLHPIEFCVQLKPSTVQGWSKEFELSWEGPGFERRDMTEGDYRHDPAMLAELKPRIEPLQDTGKRPLAEYAGQPLFVTPEEAAKLYKERDLGGNWN